VRTASLNKCTSNIGKEGETLVDTGKHGWKSEKVRDGYLEEWAQTFQNFRELSCVGSIVSALDFRVSLEERNAL
jgi:hypothetical protein